MRVCEVSNGMRNRLSPPIAYTFDECVAGGRGTNGHELLDTQLGLKITLDNDLENRKTEKKHQHTHMKIRSEEIVAQPTPDVPLNLKAI